MITIIVGSMRQDSQSLKVGCYISNRLCSDDFKQHVNMISLRELNLPLWNEEHFNENIAWQSVSQKLQESSAFVIITPEWDGMASPALKNFFNYCKNNELFHKPALLVAVSAGQGGSYPVAELRMSSYKNTRICYIPEHVLVRRVEEILNHDSPVDEDDRLIRDRIDFALNVLGSYREALAPLQEQQFLFNTYFQNGM